MSCVSTHTYDNQTVRWTSPDPAEQFSNPYLGIANNPVNYIDPDGEFAIIAGLIIKKAIMAAKVAKVAGAAGKAVSMTSAATTAGTGGKFAAMIGKAVSKKGISTGLKSGAINTISNFDPSQEGFGWNMLGDFASGFAGGSLGFGSGSKLLGLGIGGLGTWGVNGAEFSYQGAQEFVGGALSTYVGMGKAVKGKHALFKQSEGVKTLAKFDNSNFFTKALKKHGDNFIKYGLQNNAYDFAYTKEEDFRKRQGGHLDLFLWGGISGVYNQGSFSIAEKTGFDRFPFGARLEYQAFDWAINGWIKKRYDGFKVDGNKAFVSYLKWNLWFYGQ